MRIRKPEMNNQRSTYVVNKDFQVRFILKFCGLVVTGGILTIGILYVLARNSTTVAIVDSRVTVRTTADFILPLLVQTVVVVMVMVSVAAAAVMLFISHKIFGPLHRFKKVLAILVEGDFSRNFTIRKGDQLHDVEGVLNAMVSKMRERLRGMQEGSAALQEALSRIPQQEMGPQAQQLLRDAEKRAADLAALAKNFKT